MQEDALPLDVLGEIEEIVADPNLLLDVKPSIEGEGEDSLGESVDEASAPGDNSGGDFENPGNSSVGDREDNACGREEGESLGHSESEVAKLSASSDNSDSQNDDWDSGQASIESTSADSIALDGSADTEQAGAAVYELSDFLRPQREDSPIVDATGPDTPEAIIGDELGSDTSANDTESFLKCALEAVMFASDKPLTVKDIAKALQLDRRRAQEILTLLRSDYENRGFRIEEVADGFAFRSHPKIAEYVRAFLEQKPVKLSRAQLETLAIVAYRQPITRPETDDIRGVDCGPVLKGLLERDLIRVIGKKDEPGRPMLYGTTPAFLELFGLKSLEELPTLKEFTELTDESRRQFENEMGEEAPVGLADFGLSNQDEPPPDAEESAVPDASPASAEPDFDQPSIAESDDATVSEPDHSDGAPAESDEDDSDEDEDDSDEDDSDDDDSGSS